MTGSEKSSGLTLTAKEKVCLCKDAEGHPACLPEACPYANGYYDRVNALYDALREQSGSLEERAQQGESVELLAEETWKLFCAVS